MAKQKQTLRLNISAEKDLPSFMKPPEAPAAPVTAQAVEPKPTPAHDPIIISVDDPALWPSAPLPMSLKVTKLLPSAKLPVYATAGAACFDLFAVEAGNYDLRPNTQVTIRTGLAFEVPPGHVMLVYSRSGHGFNSNVRLVNSTGVIDSDYRGEVMVRLTRDSSPADKNLNSGFKINSGDRVAQAMIVPCPQVELVEVGALSTTERGAGGFGSTGSK